ncbi:hypothetical protein FGB62_76g068 [Gracilaria domingensis]|nr:hypothetical protein FGB62_76g068 [Gracilaria domingensis]
MFYSERDDVTYAIAAPHLTDQTTTIDPPNSKFLRHGQHSWSDAQRAAVRVLNGARAPDVLIPSQAQELQHQEMQSAPRALERQREDYSSYAPQPMSDSDSEDADDFDDDLSYDSYISDSKMSDVTEEAEEFQEHCRRSAFADESESQPQCL